MLRQFWVTHRDAEGCLRAWAKEVEHARWENPAQVKDKYRTASIIDDRRVVFNVCGNKYRLVVWVRYDAGRVMTRWIGTHGDYGKLDVRTL